MYVFRHALTQFWFPPWESTVWLVIKMKKTHSSCVQTFSLYCIPQPFKDQAWQQLLWKLNTHPVISDTPDTHQKMLLTVCLQAAESAQHCYSRHRRLAGPHRPAQVLPSQAGHGGHSAGLCRHGLHHDRGSWGLRTLAIGQPPDRGTVWASSWRTTKHGVHFCLCRKRASTCPYGANTTGWLSGLATCMRTPPARCATFFTVTCSRPTTLSSKRPPWSVAFSLSVYVFLSFVNRKQKVKNNSILIPYSRQNLTDLQWSLRTHLYW